MRQAVIYETILRKNDQIIFLFHKANQRNMNFNEAFFSFSVNPIGYTRPFGSLTFRGTSLLQLQEHWDLRSTLSQNCMPLHRSFLNLPCRIRSVSFRIF